MTPPAPLQPFASSADFLARLRSLGISPHSITGWVFGALIVFWALYTLIIIYHWVRYSYAPGTSLAAIACHLAVSFIFIGIALSGI